jgi:hypothetical protein
MAPVVERLPQAKEQVQTLRPLRGREEIFTLLNNSAKIKHYKILFKNYK